MRSNVNYSVRKAVIGLTLVARYHAFVPHEDNTIPAQLGANAFGDGSVTLLRILEGERR
jgi:hypothetical protein